MDILEEGDVRGSWSHTNYNPAYGSGGNVRDCWKTDNDVRGRNIGSA